MYVDINQTVLVQAGLLAAVVATFNVDYYKCLQPDPEDVSVVQSRTYRCRHQRLLVHQPSLQRRNRLARCLRQAVAWSIHALRYYIWYRSCSYTSCRDEDGLGDWRVLEICGILPVLLQAALVCFILGLLFIAHQAKTPYPLRHRDHCCGHLATVQSFRRHRSFILCPVSISGPNLSVVRQARPFVLKEAFNPPFPSLLLDPRYPRYFRISHLDLGSYPVYS